jgi:hypothetical protein
MAVEAAASGSGAAPIVLFFAVAGGAVWLLVFTLSRRRR